MSRPFFLLWSWLGRLAYSLARPIIRWVVRGSRRSRVLIVCDNDYLLLKQWLGDGSWSLPGGGLHKGEDSLRGALREVTEELGLSLQPEELISRGHYDCRDGGFNFSYDLYVIRLPFRPELQLQRLEILSAVWYDRSYVPTGRLTPEVAVALANWPE